MFYICTINQINLFIMATKEQNWDRLTYEELIDLQASYCDDEDFNMAQIIEEYIDRRFGY